MDAPTARPISSETTVARLRIGPVVAISLFVGLVTAMVCVLVPFGGAPENVIAGGRAACLSRDGLAYP
jgi:hypothetical protein